MPMRGLMPEPRAAFDEVDHPVHHPVVGDGYRRLAVGRRGGDHIPDPGRTVEHRELGVEMQMDEGVARRHHRSAPLGTTRLGFAP